jgi:hypothetical protein
LQRDGWRNRRGTPGRHDRAEDSGSAEQDGFAWESGRDDVDNEAGWPLYLQRYAAVIERNA